MNTWTKIQTQPAWPGSVSAEPVISENIFFFLFCFFEVLRFVVSFDFTAFNLKVYKEIIIAWCFINVPCKTEMFLWKQLKGNLEGKEEARGVRIWTLNSGFNQSPFLSIALCMCLWKGGLGLSK